LREVLTGPKTKVKEKNAGRGPPRKRYHGSPQRKPRQEGKSPSKGKDARSGEPPLTKVKGKIVFFWKKKREKAKHSTIAEKGLKTRRHWKKKRPQRQRDPAWTMSKNRKGLGKEEKTPEKEFAGSR